MKISTGIAAGLMFCGLLLGGCADQANPVTGAPMAKPENASQTAQSIGITFNGIGETLTLPSEDAEWEFDPNCARDFFEVTGTTGSPSGGQQGAAITQIVMDNKCTFFNGGTLVGGTIIFGPRTVTVAPKNTTAYPATVPTAQCWTLSGEAGSSDVEFQADIAGESLVVRNSGTEDWEKKFSFSLTEGETSRVTDVTYYLEKWNGTDWDVVDSYVVGTVDDITSGEFTHNYVENGGTFGEITGQLVSGYTIGAILDDEGGISEDNFANNNSTNSPDSDGNAMVAHGPTHTFSIGTAGSYQIRVDATVKGNTGSAIHSFTATGGGGSVSGAPNCD